MLKARPISTQATAEASTPTGCQATFQPANSQPGVYAYVLPAIGSCPGDSSSLDISVSQAAQAGTGGDTTLCSSGAPFPLSLMLSGPYDLGGLWTGPGGAPSNGVLDPAVAASGTYSYTVAAPAPCPDAVATVEVTLQAVPVIAPSISTGDGCAPLEVTLTSGYSGNGICHWDLGDGTDTTACGPITVTYGEPGSYTVTFTVTGPDGCGTSAQVDQLVHVVDRPEAAFSIVGSGISTSNPVAAFANESTGAADFHWDFGGLGSSSEVNPQFTFPNEAEAGWTVCLIAYASPGCADTTCTELLVPASASVMVPNAFTPDGDGRNDGFAPVTVGLDPDDFHFIVMDRWGKAVFTTEDPQAVWDGNFGSGDAAPVGVYVWKLTGQDLIAKTRFERIGHVTLVR